MDLGRKELKMKARLVLESLIVALGLTSASYIAGLGMGWISSVNWLEAFAVFTSYSCTYLCVKQSRLNYPIGVISVAALSLLFYQQGLYASMVLNMYLFPTLVWGWFRWRPDEITRPVTRVGKWWWPVYLLITYSVWYTLTTIATAMNATLASWDSAILALSILAQFFLDQKKMETWSVWFVVNVISITTYWQAGLQIVAIQFVFFLLNTAYGHYSWKQTMEREASHA